MDSNKAVATLREALEKIVARHGEWSNGIHSANIASAALFATNSLAEDQADRAATAAKDAAEKPASIDRQRAIAEIEFAADNPGTTASSELAFSMYEMRSMVGVYRAVKRRLTLAENKLAAPISEASAAAASAEQLQDWLTMVHDNEYTLGDRLQRLACRISLALDGKSTKKHVIREQSAQPEAKAEQPSDLAAHLKKLGDVFEAQRQKADNEDFERICIGSRDAYYHAAELARTPASVTSAQAETVARSIGLTCKVGPLVGCGDGNTRVILGPPVIRKSRNTAPATRSIGDDPRWIELLKMHDIEYDTDIQIISSFVNTWAAQQDNSGEGASDAAQ